MATEERDSSKNTFVDVDTNPDPMQNRIKAAHSQPVFAAGSDFIEEVSKRVVKEMMSQCGDNGNGGQNGHHRTFLGFDWQGWLGWALKGTAVVGIFLFTWYNTVNESLGDRATHEEVDTAVQKAVKTHKAHDSHPRLEAIVEKHSEQLQELHEVQIRQTAIMETQAQTLRDVRQDLRRRRR